MKQTVILIVLMMFSVQLSAQKKVAFGFKGGLNLSTITHFDRDGVKPGLHIGGLLHWRLNAKWRLQPELYFSMQGAPDGKYQQEENYNYIVLPVLAQYRFTGKFFVEAGPQVALLVNPHKMDAPADPNIPNTGHHENLGDFLMAAGVGYEFNRHFGVYCRYNQGLVSIGRSSGGPGQYNVVGQAGLVLKF